MDTLVYSDTLVSYSSIHDMSCIKSEHVIMLCIVLKNFSTVHEDLGSIRKKCHHLL